MTAARLVARCVRGLEPTVAAEILQLGLGTITHLGHREVHFRTSRPDQRTAGLRTADDVFLLVARLPDVGPARAAARELAELAAGVDAGTLLGLRRRCGGPAGLAGVEVSASFLGRRNFNRYDAEDAVGTALARLLGVGYHSRRGGAAPPPSYGGWRLTLDGTTATLMLRITERPLHRRAYKVRTIPGTLHPPVAAAMARMAGIRPGDRVLDPCCGAGTLLVEAAHLQPGAHFQGYDANPEALHAARANAAQANVAQAADAVQAVNAEHVAQAVTAGYAEAALVPGVSVAEGDAGELPVGDGGADRVVCNPPWGGQVRPYGLLAADPARWWAEVRRVLAPDGTAVILIPDAGELAAAIRHGLTPVHVQQVRLSGLEPYLVRLEARSHRSSRSGGRPGGRRAAVRPGRAG